MCTRKMNNIILGFIGIFAFVTLIPKVQAQQPMDMTSCLSGNTTIIAASEEWTIMSMENKGINMDNLASKIFDNMTIHSAALFKIESGKMTAIFYAKYMDPSGDFFVVEVSQIGPERDWKFLYGTGKWKGVTGGGKAIMITRGKPISPGTSQYCLKITGAYELKK